MHAGGQLRLLPPSVRLPCTRNRAFPYPLRRTRAPALLNLRVAADDRGGAVLPSQPWRRRRCVPSWMTKYGTLRAAVAATCAGGPLGFSAPQMTPDNVHHSIHARAGPPLAAGGGGRRCGGRTMRTGALGMPKGPSSPDACKHARP
eukprot:353090-Chlamydomonas_euryale.AAC.10